MKLQGAYQVTLFVVAAAFVGLPTAEAGEGGDLGDALAYISNTVGEAQIAGYEDEVDPHENAAIAMIISRNAPRGKRLEDYSCDGSLIDDGQVMRTSGEERWSHRACLESQFIGDKAHGYKTLGNVRLRPQDIEPWLRAAEAESGVPPRLVHSMIKFLSGYRPHAISNEGHIGIMQLRPDLLRAEGIEFNNLLDPRENVRVGMQYLRRLWFVYKSTMLIASAYLHGREFVVRADGVPKDRKTIFLARELFRLFYAGYYPFPKEQGAEHMAFVWNWME